MKEQLKLLEKAGIPGSSKLPDVLKFIKEKDECCLICRRTDEFSKKHRKCIFHDTKEDWYKLDINGEKIWDRSLIKKFWEEIRKEKTDKSDFNFHRFVFPGFESYDLVSREDGEYLTRDSLFWRSDDKDLKKMEFPTNTSFQFSTFIDSAGFQFVNFKGEIDFNHCTFLDTLTIQSSIFQSKVNFERSNFHKKCLFHKVEFKNKVNFALSEFHSQTQFVAVSFTEIVDFSKVSFFENVEFLYCETTNGNLFFLSANFFKKLEIWNEKRDEKKFTLSLEFDNAVFESASKISNQNLKIIQFFGSSGIDKIDFQRCFWGKKAICKKVDLDKMDQDKKYEGIERVYQQLKRNYENRGDYETAGNFHVGEMEMRRKKIKEYIINKNTTKNRLMKFCLGIWNWITVDITRRILLFFYKISSNYGESPGRVFLWIFFLIPTYSITYWFLNNFQSLKNSVEASIVFFIPLFPDINDLASQFNPLQRTVYYSELLISSIIWFLLIISIRRKFKR